MLQILLGSVWYFGIYLLVASAFALYLRFIKVLDFGFVVILAFGSFGFWYFYPTNIFLGLGVSFLSCFVFSFLTYRYIYQNYKATIPSEELIIGMVVTDLFANLFLVFLGSNIKVVGIKGVKLEFFGSYFDSNSLIFLVIVLLIYFGVIYLFKKSSYGLVINCLPNLKKLNNLGFDVYRIQFLVVTLGLFCLWISSIGIAISQNLQFSFLVNIIIKGWLIALISQNKIEKVLFTTLILIFVELFGTQLLNSEFRDVIFYGFVLIWLALNNIISEFQTLKQSL